jgi:hypothetical protein
MMATQFLDVTGKSVLTSKPEDLADCGWCALPEPPLIGGMIMINDQIMRVLGFQYLVRTTTSPVTSSTQLNVPAMQVFICVPGQEPRIGSLVGAPASALNGMPPGAVIR